MSHLSHGGVTKRVILSHFGVGGVTKRVILSHQGVGGSGKRVIMSHLQAWGCMALGLAKCGRAIRFCGAWTWALCLVGRWSLVGFAGARAPMYSMVRKCHEAWQGASVTSFPDAMAPGAGGVKGRTSIAPGGTASFAFAGYGCWAAVDMCWFCFHG